ncbi:hypothetical protein OIV83_004091 [Microbotryomycetes sp. JL201]|nr:hypothetical protein OIV83_004091 [Microbotryomycetes sp. JL201]
MSQPQQSQPTAIALDSLPHEQVLLVLCGVVGSGKSTLASAIVRNLPVQQAYVVPKRNLILAPTQIRTGLEFVKTTSRRTWLEVANAFPTVKVAAMVMSTSPDNHPTVDNPKLALQLLDRFLSLWQEPRVEEGFDWLVWLPRLPSIEGLTPTYLENLIASALRAPQNPAAHYQRQVAVGGFPARSHQTQPQLRNFDPAYCRPVSEMPSTRQDRPVPWSMPAAAFPPAQHKPPTEIPRKNP